MSKRRPEPIRRVLAIDISIRGFGFAVLENADNMIDWGVVYVRGTLDTVFMKNFDRKVDSVLPGILVLEDVAQNPRRTSRAVRLTALLRAHARERNIKVHMLSPRAVRKLLLMPIGATKRELAEAVAERVPEIADLLPPVRKPWATEHPRTAIFDAAALALAYSEKCEKGSRRTSRSAFQPQGSEELSAI